MKFSIKKEQLQPTSTTASLMICYSESVQQPVSDITAVLSKQLLADDNKNFVAAQQLVEKGLMNHAVWLLRHHDYESIQQSAVEVAKWMSKQQEVAVDLSSLSADDAKNVTEILVVAVEEAIYCFDDFKQETQHAPLVQVIFYAGNHDIQSSLDVGEATVHGLNLCKNLANMPANVCTPKYLADQAKIAAEAVGVEAKIMNAETIQNLGMGAFWSVAKGSDAGAYLIELSYFGAPNREDPPVVLVGKGITFDSGGISLKPGLDMDEMKFDMCGAATVISTICAAAKLKLPINIVVVVPTCENMPSGHANKPGDIVKSMNGLTIEVLNTDAEGRLILCDALTYAERFKPKAVIDVATLTGACIIALGHVASGVLGNNQELIDGLLTASQAVNDKLWPLPLFDEYKEQLKSNFADLQNIGGRPAGTVTAAVFLSYFAEKYAWAHLDIAGTAWKSGKEKGATGRPVPLLLQYLRSQAQNH